MHQYIKIEHYEFVVCVYMVGFKVDQSALDNQ